MEKNFPRVGVGVIVVRGGRILLGKRIGSHGAGTWALPGGHLEYGETVEDCAVREVREETGLAIDVLGRGPYTSDVFPEAKKHYITLFVEARSDKGEPQILEPTRCLSWQWFSWSALPEPKFPPLASLVKTGFVPTGAR
ncbi:MAG: nucleotide triphosphate diphosphatase NUDT15 [Thermodesulfobacteriota bacterium]